MFQFSQIPVGAIIKTACGQYYKKRSSRTIEMAEGHSHYDKDNIKWFYARQNEMFYCYRGM